MHFKNIVAQTLCICLLSNTIYGSTIDFNDDTPETNEITMSAETNGSEITNSGTGSVVTNSIGDSDIALPDISTTITPDPTGTTTNPLKEINPEAYISPEPEEIEINLVPDEEISPVGLTVAGTENGIERIRTGWNNTAEGKKYILDNGLYAKGLTEIDGIWYAFKDDGGIPDERMVYLWKSLLC